MDRPGRHVESNLFICYIFTDLETIGADITRQ
jgi:hypothetical protein